MKWQGARVIGRVMDLLSQCNDQRKIPFVFWWWVKPDQSQCVCLPNHTPDYLSQVCIHCVSTWEVTSGPKKRSFFLNQMDRLTSCAFSGLIQARGGVVPWQGCLICIWHTAAQSSAHLRSGSYSIHHINQTPVVVDLNEKMHGSPKRWLIVTDPADPNESF